MEIRPEVTKMTDEELRRLCAAVIAICMSWIDRTEDPIWSEVADEAYRRGWTKAPDLTAMH